MMHKVVMSNLHVTADDNFIRYDKRHDLRVFFSEQESPIALVPEPSVSRITCLLVPPEARKLLVNCTQVYTASSTEGRADSTLASPE